MFEILGTLVLVALIVLGVWLVRRAWGSRRKWVKRIGVPLAGLLTFVSALMLMLALIGFYKLSVPPSHTVPAVKIINSAEQVARGQYLAQILCASCHSPQNELPLSGGKNLSDDVGLPLGSLYASNLTPSGDLTNWTDGEILRALRWGQHRGGRALAMPVKSTSQLSDADAQAIVAYLRSQPAVENKLPATSPSLLLGILIGANQFDLSAAPDTGGQSAPDRNVTAEYGQYLVNIADCKACHGEDLLGGKPPAPQGPSLLLVKGWTQAQFVDAMRTGVLPDGDVMEEVMPWKTLAKMDDVDLAAMYAYLHTLPIPPD
jgi:mono/diheme cytochrome c family protein